MSYFLCTIHACVKFSPILAQRQLLGARKHEGGGKKGILLKRWKRGKQVKKSGGCLKSESLFFKKKKKRRRKAGRVPGFTACPPPASLLAVRCVGEGAVKEEFWRE